VQKVVHTVLLSQIKQDREKILLAADDIFGIKDVLFQDKSKDLHDFYPAYPEFRSILSRGLQFLATFVNEFFKKRFEGCNNVCIFRQNEGDICQVSKQNGCIIDGDILFITHHIFYNFSDDLE
jgi:hypothetical protein